MDRATRIKIAENKLIHGRGKTIYECADHVNKSHSYLCRLASISEDLPFPIEIAVPLMKFKNDYTLLQEIAWECGFVVTKVPPAKVSKGDEQEMTLKYQEVLSNVIPSLLSYFKNPTEKNYLDVIGRIRDAVEESISIKKYIDKKQSRQEELF